MLNLNVDRLDTSRTRIPYSVLLAGLLCGAALFLLLRPRGVEDAVFDGKPVSQWVLQLNSPAARDREEAEQTIRRFNSDAVPAVVRLLRTRDPFLAKPLRLAGAKIPTRMRNALVRKIDPYRAPLVRASAAQALRLMGAKAASARDPLRNALGDGSTCSWHAALALAGLGAPGRDSLTQSLEHSGELNETVTGYVCYALGTQGEAASNSIPALTRVLRHAKLELAEKAARALASMNSAAVPALLEASADKSPQVRVLAIGALAQIGPLARAAFPTLLTPAREGEGEVRKAALDALARIQPSSPQVLGALTNALQDIDESVRDCARQNLARLGIKPATN